MDKQKLYFIIIVLTVIAVFLSLIVFFLQKKQSAPPPAAEPTFQPMPTTVEVRVTVPATIVPTFTGAAEEELPETERNLAEQKQTLKNRLPLTESGFTITFDYEEDKFIVELNEPKTINQKAFEEWLKQNYPAIPEDRFIVN